MVDGAKDNNSPIERLREWIKTVGHYNFRIRPNPPKTNARDLLKWVKTEKIAERIEKVIGSQFSLFSQWSVIMVSSL